MARWWWMVAALASAGCAEVTCSWLCYCARQAGDCDAEESKIDTCTDVNQTKAPQKQPSCDKCKELAAADCAKRVCLPDPKHGPKYVLAYYCNGDEHVSATPRTEREAALVASRPSVSVKRADQSMSAEPTAMAQAAGRVKCSFTCGCSVKTGMCDEHEERNDMCSDKTDSTTTGRDCDFCRINAYVKCLDRTCPLVGGTNKALGSFQCPVP
jgi:hypothetical protein